MKGYHTIKINCKGGIISPGELQDILKVSSSWGVKQVAFGLRQQLLIDVEESLAAKMVEGLDGLGVCYEIDKDIYPNIVSSYPAEEVFIHHTWLSEGVYKDVMDELNYQSRLKINISDSNQSFTPLLTGNVNWVASPKSPHFWHLFIRLPRSNHVFEWDQMVYTNDVARLSRQLEAIIYGNPDLFLNKRSVEAGHLFSLIDMRAYILKPIADKLVLPAFNLPYYEGFNRYNNRYWLGIYRRSEMFSVGFLLELCQLCLITKVGQLCSTPWKSIIIKGIEEKDKYLWSALLEKHEINMRHAANELNFQVQDNDHSARRLKCYLVRKFNEWDARTFGICIGIKTKSRTEIFSSILIRRKPLFQLFGKGFFYLYDILCAKDFNPNERTASVFVNNVSKHHLAAELRNCILWYYKKREEFNLVLPEAAAERPKLHTATPVMVHQCPHCFTIYDSQYGEPENGIEEGTLFEQLPPDYCCSVCSAEKTEFITVACPGKVV